MKNESAVLIKHKHIGNINVKWDEERLLITGININEPFPQAEYVPETFMKVRFAELYDYLANFGAKNQNHKYPAECLDFSWASPFYRLVYKTLRTVDFGKTVTYSELAAMTGNPKACRAVGNAMNKNKYLIAVPCHRVIGKNYLGNFACGMDVKKILLRLEGHNDLPE